MNFHQAYIFHLLFFLKEDFPTSKLQIAIQLKSRAKESLYFTKSSTNQMRPTVLR